MNQLISELLEALRPALKSTRKAEQVLRHYWAGRVALIWTTEEVHRAANESKTVLTEQQARELLHRLHEQHNPQYGLRWSDLAETIQQSGLGRDIQRRELHRFIHDNVLALEPPTRKQPCPTGVKTGSVSSGRKPTLKSSSSKPQVTHRA